VTTPVEREPTSYLVEFECGHATWLLPDEYGDGSAYCAVCEEFKCYDVVGVFLDNDRPLS
jgi:hypothetical protein